MPPAAKTPDEVKQDVIAEQAAIEKELADNPRDETIPGGLYKRANDPNWYNAEGQIVDKNGKVKKQDDAE